MCRGAAPLMSRSRLVGFGVTGWRDDAVDPLCGAADYDNKYTFSVETPTKLYNKYT